MKKHLITLCLLLFGITTLMAQQSISVELSERSPEQTKNLEINLVDDHGIPIQVTTDITFRMIDSADCHNAKVSVSFKNTDKTHLLVFFNKDMTAKDLRKDHMVLDRNLKKQPNNKIRVCTLLENVVILEPLAEVNSMVILEKERGRGPQDNIDTIAFYIAQRRKAFFGLFNKIVLLEPYEVHLVFFVEDKIDRELPRLQDKLDSLCNDYKEALDKHAFCSNPSHKPSFSEQIKSYVSRKGSLREEIITYRAAWSNSCKQYMQYVELIDVIDTIHPDRIEYDCGQHVHHCDYCSWSLKQMYDTLLMYKMDIDSGLKTKEEVWNKVSGIYKCYSIRAKKSKKQKKSAYEINIEKYYNSLKP